jgi:hypothetical protein
MSAQYLDIDPWQTDEASFPRNGTTQEQLAFCLNYAVLAPSIYNTQPWKFRLIENAVEICIDRSRSLPVTDPSGREMTISAGAALMNLEIALNHFGFESWVQYTPDNTNPDLIARVRLGRPRARSYEDETLFRSIRRRRTVRRPFQSRQVPRELQRRMIWTGIDYGIWLHFADSVEDRASIRTLIEEAHETKAQDRAYQIERAQYFGSIDPMPQNGSASEDLSATGVTATTTEAPIANGWMARDQKLLDSSPVLVVLGSNADSPEEWVRTGQALQRVLLHVTSLGLSASFMNQPCQIPELREQLRSMTGRSGPPQLLLRMGYAQPTKPTPRRPVREVLRAGSPV